MFKISSIVKDFGDEFDPNCDPTIYFNDIDKLKAIFQDILDKKDLKKDDLEKIFAELNRDFSTHEDIFLNNFFHIKDSEEFLSFHIINTMFLSSALCRWVGFFDELIERAIQIAFFLNLSLKHIESILKKKEGLADKERALIDQHSLVSMQIFSSVYPKDKEISFFIENHHNYNFRRRGFRSKELKKACKLILLSASFEFFIHPQPHRRAVTPHEAINKILSGFRNIDKGTKKDFINYIGMYPITSIVGLNNGKRAVVVNQNRCFPFRPKVRILEEEAVGKGKLIDLLSEKDIFIKEILG